MSFKENKNEGFCFGFVGVYDQLMRMWFDLI